MSTGTRPATSLVTGATGHVGYNLVRHLTGNGERVRAGVRDVTAAGRVRELGAEIARTELLEPGTLVAAMEGIDVVYAVAAAFKSWARDPQREIIDVNVHGAVNVVEAAAKAGVRRIVYVSSMTTLDPSVQPFSAETWNPLNLSPYDYSKTLAERKAAARAEELGVEFVSILPAAITGPGFARPTESTELFPAILAGKLPIDPRFYLLISDARDVAAACYLASAKGLDGARYIVSSDLPISTTEMVAIAQQMYPELGIKTPRQLPLGALKVIARVTSRIARLTRRPPALRPEIVNLYGGASHLRADTRRTRAELGLTLMSNEKSVRDSFTWAHDHFTGTPAGF